MKNRSDLKAKKPPRICKLKPSLLGFQLSHLSNLAAVIAKQDLAKKEAPISARTLFGKTLSKINLKGFKEKGSTETE
jgi:hypothetical protein